MFVRDDLYIINWTGYIMFYRGVHTIYNVIVMLIGMMYVTMLG